MVVMDGYFDGNAVRTFEPIVANKNQKVRLTFLDEYETSTDKKSMFGSLKDVITYIADDFDAPLDDFAEYE